MTMEGDRGPGAVFAAQWSLRRPGVPEPDAGGIETVTVVPSPRRLSIPRLPAWSSTSARTIARPRPVPDSVRSAALPAWRSEEHTSELQSLMRISYAVFCLTKKKRHYTHKEYTS